MVCLYRVRSSMLMEQTGLVCVAPLHKSHSMENSRLNSLKQSCCRVQLVSPKPPIKMLLHSIKGVCYS